jgi:metal-responsive CopG/Arc/MetJ family transcriptional regulator
MAVTPEFTRELDSLTADGNSETRSELIRKAVALYVHAREQESHGRKLGFFVEENGEQVVKQIVSLND